VRVVVTGASRGLGLGFCAVLAERGDEVVAVCRRSTPELDALGVHVVEGVDVTSDETVQRLGEAVGPEPVDVVVCNAGLNASFDAGIEDLDLEAMGREYQVNSLGAVRTVKALLPRLREGSKVAFVTTGAGATGRGAPSPGNYGYRMSKAALNVFTFLLAGELHPRGIPVIVLSPGPVDTDMLRAVFDAGRTPQDPSVAGSPRDVGRDLLAHIEALDIDSSGSWLNRAGEPMGT
jgi:NAD(P)-dependent dehydrogenase (short-subunit alcohol dehydrogenase family)